MRFKSLVMITMGAYISRSPKEERGGDTFVLIIFLVLIIPRLLLVGVTGVCFGRSNGELIAMQGGERHTEKCELVTRCGIGNKLL
jgi:hypothetical protein